MVNDFGPLHIQIRRWEKPSRPYTWEIWTSETICVALPNIRRAAQLQKLRKRALQRIILKAVHSPSGGVFGGE
jgi:hypothetical protein